MYESGIHNIPVFDAHIEVYSNEKTVRIQYDTPYIKGLPIKIYITENDGGALKETTLLPTYEDAYTQELRELYESFTAGKPAKTTIDDAENDLKICQMILRAL